MSHELWVMGKDGQQDSIFKPTKNHLPGDNYNITTSNVALSGGGVCWESGNKYERPNLIL